MPANIETCMIVGGAWHTQGVRVDSEKTAADAIALAGLNWRVGLRSVYAEGVTEVLASLDTVPRAIAGFKAIVRETDNAVLGVVGDRYTPIQNDESFAFFDELVGEGRAIYHSAGSLDGGRKVWLLAKMPDTLKLPGGDVDKFLLLTTTHDGSGAHRTLPTPIRVVCQNTLNMALAGAGSTGFSFRHTKSAGDKMREAVNLYGKTQSYYTRFGELANALAKATFTEEQIGMVAGKLFPAEDENKVPTRTQNARSSIIDLFDNGMRHTAEIRGTAWAAYNAVAEYVDHNRPTRAVNGRDAADATAQSLLFGSGASMKQEGLELVAASAGISLEAAGF